MTERSLLKLYGRAQGRSELGRLYLQWLETCGELTADKVKDGLRWRTYKLPHGTVIHVSRSARAAPGPSS